MAGEHLKSGRSWCQLLLLVVSAFDISKGNGMHNIHWNSSNPLFRNTDNIIQVNGGNHPWEYDQVNIVCPTYKPGMSKDVLQEKYIVYVVSKQEYESCRISEPNPRIIAVCDQPHELMYFTITFRSFTPTPGGLEFRPGQSYYFISTSSRNDIHRRVGGGCSTHNMKITFKVAEAKRTKPILTIEEKNNHLAQAPQHGRDSIHPKHLMKPSQSVAATLYYPQLEIAKVKEFFYHRKPKEFVHQQEPHGPQFNSGCLRIKLPLPWEILLLITSIRFML